MGKDFANKPVVRTAALKRYVCEHSDAPCTEQSFRRAMYAMEKSNVITRVGKGTYAVTIDVIRPSPTPPTFPSISTKIIFKPSFSQIIEKVNHIVSNAFPLINYRIWETRILYQFMIHQPIVSLTVLKVEKDAAEFVFNYLNDELPGKVYLNPDQLMIERYVTNIPDALIVSNLITKTSRKIVKNIPFPKLENILVDVFTDKKMFYYYQGQELVNIFENAFEKYQIDERTLFGYARRRKADKKLKDFITLKTNITLYTQPI